MREPSTQPIRFTSTWATESAAATTASSSPPTAERRGRSQAFTDFAKTNGSFDVYHVEPDPTDFNHVLVSFHSGWKGEPKTA